MDITPNTVTPNGNTVTVSYDVTGDHAGQATHVSVLVTDGEWTENGWTVGEVKYYKQFAITNNNKSVSFDLPADYKASWKTYILAENVATGEYAANTTDYASAPVELFPVESVTLNKGNLEFTIGGTTLTETLTATVSPDNALNKSVTWSTSDTNVATVTDSGEVTGVGAGTAVIKVMSAVNSKISADCTVKVNKGTPKVTKAPAANNRTYDGTTQPLVTTGTAEGGTMFYATGTSTKQITDWTEKIPTGTNPANYYVWYMVSGDVNHKDTDAQTVTVYITKPVVTPTESGGSDNSDTDGKTEKQKSGDSTTTGGNNSGSGSGNGSSNTGGKAEEQKSGDSSATDGSSNGSDSSNNGQKVTVGFEKAHKEVADVVEKKLTELLPGLPDDVEFFSDPDNMEFKGVNGLTSYIEKIIDELKGTVRELTAVMSPVSVKTAGVYFVKVNVTEEQSKELIGTRNLAYHIELYLENKEEAQVRIADAGEGESDIPNGIFVDENGDVVSGDYGGGDIYLLAYMPQADTTYVQYMTAEADQKPLEETTGNSSSPTSDSTSPSGYSGPTSNKGPGGCDAGFGGLAGLMILPLLARRRKK